MASLRRLFDATIVRIKNGEIVLECNGKFGSVFDGLISTIEGSCEYEFLGNVLRETYLTEKGSHRVSS